MKVYEVIASALVARENCLKSGNTEWFRKHTERIQQLASDWLPSGSGIDSGTTVNLDKSTDDRLVLETSFHHMGESGMYDGWTEHTVTVRPSLAFGIDVRISGRNRNDIKEYLAETFHYALTREIEQTEQRTA